MFKHLSVGQMVWIAAGILLATAASVARAQEKAPGDKPKVDPPSAQSTGQLFGRLDANQDGTLTADEAGTEHRRLFRRLLRKADKNEDGQLDREEFIAGLRPADRPPVDQPHAEAAPARQTPTNRPDREAIFRRLDTNNDGKIVLEDIPEGRRENFITAFRRMDKNEDNALSLREFIAVGRPAARPPERRPPSDKPPGGDRLFGVIDTDGDGTLSPGELKSAAKVLRKLDRDGDGSVTLREAAAPQIREDAPNRGRAEELLIRFNERDKDGDGKWSPQEAPPRLADNFARVDANGDGFLDKAELKRVLARLNDRAGPPEGRQPRQKKDQPAKPDQD